MKIKKKMILIAIFLLIIATLSSIYIFKRENPKPELSYVYEKSMHSIYRIEKDIVVIDDSIVVKNNTNRDLYFNMYAYTSEDGGFSVKDLAPACEKNSLQKEKFFIKPKSETTFEVHFKGEKGKTKKSDRLPPKDVRFEIVK